MMGIGILILIGLIAEIDNSNGVVDLVNLTNRLVVEQEDDWETDCEKEEAAETVVDGTVVPKYGAWLKDDDPIPNGFRAFHMRQARLDHAAELETENGQRGCKADALETGERRSGVDEGDGNMGSLNRSGGVGVVGDVARNGLTIVPKVNSTISELGRLNDGSNIAEKEGVGPNSIGVGLSNTNQLHNAFLWSSSLLGSIQCNREVRTDRSDRLDGYVDLKKRKCGAQVARAFGKGKEIIDVGDSRDNDVGSHGGLLNCTDVFDNSINVEVGISSTFDLSPHVFTTETASPVDKGRRA
uniref:Uncharacterized protein n=1 Tax=Cannabis sativa TaxID=3483 RepID=A0A803PQV9_CANSA